MPTVRNFWEERMSQLNTSFISPLQTLKLKHNGEP